MKTMKASEKRPGFYFKMGHGRWSEKCFFLFFHILYESNEKEILRIEDALFKHISVY